MRLDRAYGSAPIQEFVKEKVANGYIYSVRFNVAWEIFGATIDVSSRIDKDQSALDEIKRDLEWEWRCSNCDFDLTDNYEDFDIKTPRELGLFFTALIVEPKFWELAIERITIVNDKTKIAADLRHAADYPRDWMRRLDPRLGVPTTLCTK